MESGGGGGGVDPRPPPTTSPFHSEKAREEVELLRRRPAALDLEQARMEAERVMTSTAKAHGASGLEPDYSAAFGGNSGVGPRGGSCGGR